MGTENSSTPAGVAPAVQQSAGPANGTQQPVSTQGGATPEANPMVIDGVDYSKINLDNHPNFRDWKSQMDKKLDSYTKEQKRLYDMNQQAIQRARQLEQQLELVTLEGKDDYTVLQHNYNKMVARAQQLESQLQQINNERNREKFVASMKDEYGVDLSSHEFQTPQEAVILIARLQQEKAQALQEKIAMLEKKAGAIEAASQETPELGGGTGAVGVSSLQKQFNEAMLNLQGVEADRIARQAVKEGITLDRKQWLTMRTGS